MAGQKILIVEDERNIVRLLQFNLEAEGYRVCAAYDGEAGLAALRKEKPDLVLLDLMLPKVDGYEFCRQARKDSSVPILMLTARKAEVDKLLGLELGADDYVTKPFGIREVLSRVKAILRRTSPTGDPGKLLRAGKLELDPARYEVRVAGKPATLSSKEFELLKVLLESDGRVLTREDILEKVWGYDRSLELDTRTVDQHVKRLREKLGAEAQRLVTVKNVGYRIKPG
ncbi:MAG TPA: response regulator transcription factor [Elusimicrobiota bacterium]|jgi:DNA-binding response OmpR family regulator|nr:response regulator transcription factor [Elusimicrobiota bacterium]